MNDILKIIYLVVFTGIAIYLLKKILSLFSKGGLLYLYDHELNKSFWGYMTYQKSRKTHRIFTTSNGLMDRCVGEVQVKEDGLAWVRCWKQGYSPDELPQELGYVNLKGEVFTYNHQYVGHIGQAPGKPDTDGITKWTELFLKRHAEIFLSLKPKTISNNNTTASDTTTNSPNQTDYRQFGHVVETGRFRKHKAHEYTILARAAAFLLLYQRFGWLKPEEEEKTTEIYAWGDTALLSSVIFMFLYGLFYIISPQYVMFPFMGERLSFLLAMFLLYLLLWAIVREIKIEMSLKERPIGWWLSLFNSNVGLSSYNWLISIFSAIGLSLSVYSFGGDFAPFLLAILIGVTVNERTYSKQVWETRTRFAYSPDIPLTPPDNSGEIVKEYSWKLDSPEDKSVCANLQLHFKEKEINDLRARNPFRNKEEDFYGNICLMLKESLDCKHLDLINQHIMSVSNENQLTMLESIQFILDFVQEPNIQYQEDQESTSFREYVRFPDETLFDKMGDCDCKAILAAALFHNARLKVLYITSETHAAVAVECQPEWFGGWDNPGISNGLLRYNGRYYYFCETTGDHFRVGDINGDINQFKFIKPIDIE